MEGADIIEYCRLALSVVISIAGLCLAFNLGILYAIITQSIVLVMGFLDDRHGTFLNTCQWIIFDLTILVILIIDYRSNKDQQKGSAGYDSIDKN